MSVKSNGVGQFRELAKFIILCLSFITTIVLLFDGDKPKTYEGLFLLPVAFFVFSIVFNNLYNHLFSNIGITVLMILMFARMVISPLFMGLGDYAVTISLNVKENTFKAVFLVVYEALALFVTMQVLVEKERKKKKKGEQYCQRPIIPKRYTKLIILLLACLLLCIAVTPELLKAYRTILHIRDKDFTSMEDSYIVSAYGTTFVTKLSLVTGMYLMRTALILVPAYLLIKCARKKTPTRKILGLFACFIPVFFIGGAIARSLIYVVCLMLLYNNMFGDGKIDMRIIGIFGIAGFAVIGWWFIRSDSTVEIFAQFSKRFSAYFSGVNVVSGSFNLPDNLSDRIRLILYDFTSTVPYGNTIFQITGTTVQPFFNMHNASTGQIPTTIGTAYYYFGFLLAPIYSIVFATVVVKSGIKLKAQQNPNPFRCLRLILMVFYFSMGIIMYNIEITMTNFYSLILPMYLLERLAYRRKPRRRKL